MQAAPLLYAPVDADPASVHFGTIAIDVRQYPELDRVGGAVSVQLSSLPSDTSKFMLPYGGILLVQRAAGDFIAVEAACPHAQCPLGYDAEQQLIACPCHASTFEAVSDGTHQVGDVLHLPARAPLATWKVTYASPVVRIDLTSSATATGFPPVVGKTVTIPVAQFPALAQPGGSLVGKPNGLGDTLAVLRADATTVICVSAVCTHAKCLVSLDAQREWFCACHQSAFSATGTALRGPAPLPLKSYSAAFDGTNIVITVA